MIGSPRLWATLDYMRHEGADASGAVQWTMSSQKTLHGFCLWFESDLVEGVTLTTAPSKPEAIYGNMFLPVSDPVDVSDGDLLSLELDARLINTDYLWRWRTTVSPKGKPDHPKIDFRQSNWFSEPLAAASLHKHDAGFKAIANQQGRIDRTVLMHLDGKTSNGEIAQRLVDEFPSEFSTWVNALTRVNELAEKYAD
jgi:protein arginine N-methyltransferase 1